MIEIERAGVQLHYADRGPKGAPVVVLHHPLTFDHTCFDSSGLTGMLLDNGYRLILPVSLAHGSSGFSHEPARYKQPERTADVQAVLDHAGVERFAFVGYSMGGWIGTGLVNHDPGRVTALVIGGWDPIGGPAGARWMVRPMLAVSRMRKTERTVHKVDREAMRLAFSTLYDPYEPLSRTAMQKVPTLVWAGDKDPYLPRLRKIAAEHPVVLRESRGNHLTALDNPLSADLCLSFLTSQMPPVSSTASNRAPSAQVPTGRVEL